MRERAYRRRGLDAWGGASNADGGLFDDFATDGHVPDHSTAVRLIGGALEAHQRSTYMHHVMRLAKELLDATCLRRRNVDDGLVGLHRHQRLIDFYLIAFLDMPLDDFG